MLSWMTKRQGFRMASSGKMFHCQLGQSGTRILILLKKSKIIKRKKRQVVSTLKVETTCPQKNLDKKRFLS
jgi:hypothetical protein